MADYINHVTLNTGDIRKSPRSEVWQDSIVAASAMITESLKNGKTLIMVEEQVHILAEREGNGLFVEVYLGDDVSSFLTFAIALKPEDGYIWDELVEDVYYEDFGKMPSVKKPREPWVAVALSSFAEADPAKYFQVIQYMGDMERCFAWAWEAMLKKENVRPQKALDKDEKVAILSMVKRWGSIKPDGQSIEMQADREIREKFQIPEGEVANDVRLRLAGEFEIACLILSMGGEPTIHLVNQTAARLIEGTRFNLDIVDYLDDLKEPLILTAKSGYLFGSVREFAIFFLEDTNKYHVLQNVEMNGEPGIQVMFLEKGAFIERRDDLQENADPAITSEYVYTAAEQAFIYALKFRRMMQSEKTPIEAQVTDSHSKILKKGIGRTIPSYRTVSLSQTYVRRRKEMEAARQEMQKGGKHLALVEISGFIREQPYGPGRSLRKTIWVDGFESHRWRKEGVQIVNVKE